MATTPGILTEWPWTPLGSFKYLILAPWALTGTYSYVTSDNPDFSNMIIIPYLISRMIHNQIWITLSRYRTAKGNNRIVDKGLEFDQVDRERNWDDQILLNGIVFYVGNKVLSGGSHLPVWRTDGIIITGLLHVSAVEFLYYWFHRALHHHFLYSRYHSHHHSSVVTEPITSVIHPFGEHIVYYMLFMIPILTTVFTRTASLTSIAGYIAVIDFMNNLGHCNFEFIPKRIFTLFPPLKYLIYTPSFHSLHHTQFRTNYCLFMPFYDYLYGTVDKSSDSLYESSLERTELANVLHLTHLTSPDSVYYLPTGFAGLASKPYTSKWYLWLMWPVTLWSVALAWIHGRAFVVDRHRFHDLKLQTWSIPKYKIQYLLRWQNASINGLIEDAILDADEKGVEIVTLGLFNQSEELNAYGELYVKRHPQLKIKLVDGSTLAVAVVLNKLPKRTSQVLLRGNLTKVAYSVASALCQKGIKVVTVCEEEYVKLSRSLIDSNFKNSLTLSKNYSSQVWLVGDGMTEEEQGKASKGTIFVPFSQFPPKKVRSDCFYHHTPAMLAPKSLENVHACENWLPRRVMSAWRIAGIIHAMEGWSEHECCLNAPISNVDKVWEATLRHGFRPLTLTKD